MWGNRSAGLATPGGNRSTGLDLDGGHGKRRPRIARAKRDAAVSPRPGLRARAVLSATARGLKTLG